MWMFSLGNVIDLIKDMENKRIKLSDISLLDYVSPVYAISLASFINQWMIEKDLLWVILPELQTYLDRCWFLHAIDLKDKNKYIGNSQNLIEITPIISREQNELLVSGGVDEICAKLFVRAKNIQKESTEGKRFLDNLENTLLLAVTELLDNINIHSEADLSQKASMYMMQYYPSKKKTHLAIIDSGIGIVESLKKSSHFNSSREDKDYLKLSLEKNITNGKGKGNGLAMVREIIEETSSKLEIYSNGVLFTKNWHDEKIEYTWVSFNGTIINIEFNMEAIEWEKQERLKSFSHICTEMEDLDFYEWIFE